MPDRLGGRGGWLSTGSGVLDERPVPPASAPGTAAHRMPPVRCRGCFSPSRTSDCRPAPRGADPPKARYQQLPRAWKCGIYLRVCVRLTPSYVFTAESAPATSICCSLQRPPLGDRKISAPVRCICMGWEEAGRASGDGGPWWLESGRSPTNATSNKQP